MMSKLSSSYLSLIVMVKQLSSLVKMDFNRFLNKSDYHILWSKSEIITPPPRPTQVFNLFSSRWRCF